MSLNCNFDEIIEASKDPSVLIIDVREPQEIEETGKIPGAINIPMDSVSTALSDETPSESFLATYGAAKPNKNSLLIFSCRSGRRSAISQREAINFGYTNVRNYQGGWLDWSARVQAANTHQVG
ncbi:rhodanese domain-containing protein CG4456-like isoform X2 [Cylas formicarius]|nr:rhodanese domain-containing protein CG4456-like isoform X2 [Cylas formicarius]